MKKILIVSTSPRKNSNSEALALAFAEGAKAAKAFNPTIDFDSPMDGDGHGR